MEKRSLIPDILTIAIHYLSTEARKAWFIYPLTFFITSLISASLFLKFDVVPIDANTARYVLSALIQSESAIVAVIVSLSLVAVQLTASSFSSEITGIFRNSEDLWMILTSYIGTIVLSLFVLQMVDKSSNSSFDVFFIVSCSYGVSCFVLLFFYSDRVLEMLDHKNIVKRLSERITKESLLSKNEDPLYPIMYRAKCSIRERDITVARICAKALVGRVKQIFCTQRMSIDEENQIYSRIFVTHFNRIGEIAIKEKDDDMAIWVINVAEDIGMAAMENRLYRLLDRIAFAIGKIGNDASQISFLPVVDEAIEILDRLAMYALDMMDQESREKTNFTNLLRNAIETAAIGLMKLSEALKKRDVNRSSGAKERYCEISKALSAMKTS